MATYTIATVQYHSVDEPLIRDVFDSNGKWITQQKKVNGKWIDY